MERPQKRRLEDEEFAVPESFIRPISPPNKKRRTAPVLKSPWQLTWIQDLPEDQNRDAVTLKDLLGDPLISECWEFNYLHDISFLMDAFDRDVKDLVKVHVVHGFWKHEDANRVSLEQAAAQFDNVQLHVAPMPEMFGTHHSKMMIIFRHDDTAQVIIHTANMISKDWTNMTNAVWKSPILPKTSEEVNATPLIDQPVGNGERFKSDLTNYLRSYDRRRITYEIRRSLDGYASGASIHTKIQSSQQAKQLEYLRPILHHWANDSPNGKDLAGATMQDGGRQRAAPHIKTYIRYNAKSIDWALLTSANLSKQAWGEAVHATGEVRIASWEIGVMVWPELLDRDATMVGTFQTDEPQVTQHGREDSKPVIGVRIPYNMPLQHYGTKEIPWVATLAHSEPDWMGRAWVD
ncbi:hypothetical protein G7Z17_g3315 [Cylindrodendrum hubeiense]|uniref:Tyrosyl-DNA phosphodiesterase n=1 Tax=Cylindrodendrum hubeiense TaxID=595255 RepID=A0A9P5LDN2_9HYPO|nr:hypothetical protein G7Z17_g3315 [Cylindrodendrum hubeiense]